MFLAGRQLLAARAGPANPISFVAGVSTAVSAFTNRRYSSSSSSKPSNPADGTRVLAQASPSNSARRRNFSGRRTAARQSFANPRGANLSKNSAVAPPQLPFVRSTEHMKPVDISVASFFAQHRPVSVTHPFPLTFDDNHFSSLLSSSPKSHASPAPYPESQEPVYGESGESEVSVQSVRMPGGNALRIEISTMSNDYTANEYLPFQPPPAPVPMDITSPRAERTRRSRKEVIAVISAFAPDSDAAAIIRDGIASPAILASRLRIQQRKIEEQEQKEQKEIMEEQEKADILQALSVKRQRRLKMKKHKLKKLRKLTRNLRRKLENR